MARVYALLREEPYQRGEEGVGEEGAATALSENSKPDMFMKLT